MPEQRPRIERVFAASRERVFAAWTNAEVIRRWWAPGPDWTTPVADVELRVGGRLRVTMAAPGGATHTFTGTFTEVRPPERIAYTAAWDDAHEGSETGLVSVSFSEVPDGTLVVLEFDADVDAIGGLTTGWAACFAKLDGVLAQG